MKTRFVDDNKLEAELKIGAAIDAYGSMNDTVILVEIARNVIAYIDLCVLLFLPRLFAIELYWYK